MDNREKAAKVAEMARSEGWAILQEFMQQRIEQIKDRLLRTPPDNASDIYELQAEAKSYQTLLGRVKDWERRWEVEQENGW